MEGARGATPTGGSELAGFCRLPGGAGKWWVPLGVMEERGEEEEESMEELKEEKPA